MAHDDGRARPRGLPRASAPVRGREGACRRRSGTPPSRRPVPGDRAIPIRVYRPEAGPTPPIFVYLHGGGWTFGDLDSHDHLCRRIAVATGALVVSVAYRLGPEHRAPSSSTTSSPRSAGCASTAPSSVATRRHIAVGGDSAGGNLTAGAALCLRDAGEPNFDLQVLIYPATAPYFDTLSYHENGRGLLVDAGRRHLVLGQLPRAGPGSPPRPLRRPGHPRRRGPPQTAARADHHRCLRSAARRGRGLRSQAQRRRRTRPRPPFRGHDPRVRCAAHAHPCRGPRGRDDRRRHAPSVARGREATRGR